MIKNICKNILKYYLKFIAKIVLAARRPLVIAVAGSTNKTFIKNAIVEKFKKSEFDLRVAPASFNTEIGLPLAILGLPSGYNSYKNWLPAIIQAPRKIFTRGFPRLLVLELGVSDPGDMKYLLSIVRLEIAVIADISQRYKESFSDMDALAEEYEYLAGKIKKNGLLAYNNDNPRTKSIGLKAGGKIKKISFGFAPDSDLLIKSALKREKGQEIILRKGEGEWREKINAFGQHHAYAAAAASVVKSYVKEKIRPLPAGKKI